MAMCEVCGNNYDRAFTVTLAGRAHSFDCFECAIHALAPRCAHCGCPVIGHGVEQGETIYCCDHCARHAAHSEPAQGGQREYIVYRHGWSEANQDPARGLPEKMAVARVRAASPEEACRLAVDRTSVVAGQRLSAEAAEGVDARVNNLGLKVEALERVETP
jgi:hypothetical protein